MNSGVGEAMPQPYADIPGKATNPVIPACAGEPPVQAVHRARFGLHGFHGY